jgi:hypothetical protein
MPSSNKPPEKEIDIKVEHDGTKFFVAEDIDTIGNVRKKKVTWKIKNDSQRSFYIRIHQFTQSGTVPLGLGDEEDDDFANRDCAAEKRVNPGKTKKIRGQISERADKSTYTYHIDVWDPITNQTFRIDPELQIDDVNPLDHLKPILVTIGILGALLWAYRRRGK